MLQPVQKSVKLLQDVICKIMKLGYLVWMCAVERLQLVEQAFSSTSIVGLWDVKGIRN